MTRRTAAKPLSPRVKAMIEPMMMPQSPPRAIPSRNTRLRKNVIVDHLFFVNKVIRMRCKTLPLRPGKEKGRHISLIRAGGASLQVHHCLRFTPQAFQAVIFSFLRSKDMDDHVAKV